MDASSQVFDSFVDVLTPESARRVVEYRFDKKLQARINSLARRCNEGKLTEAERCEYESFVETMDFIAILQIKARAPQAIDQWLMSGQLRQTVRERADSRCEYCHLPDCAVVLREFHVEHVIAKQHGGSDDLHNLAWCCNRCNFSKGPNLSGVDPLTNQAMFCFTRGDTSGRAISSGTAPYSPVEREWVGRQWLS